MAKRQQNPFLKGALAYYSYNWCIIPIKAGTKKPAVRNWKQYQSERPNRKQLGKWFESDKPKDMAVVCGAVSNNLAVLDIDGEDIYELLITKHPELQNYPRTRTAKGYHIYFRCKEPFRKQNGSGVDLLGEGACAVLPPSKDKSWLIPVNGEIPYLNPFGLGLEKFGIKQPNDKKILDVTEHTEQIEQTEHTEAIVIDDVYVERIINRTLPEKKGTRNCCIFNFARVLRTRYQKTDPRIFRDVVKKWYIKALPNVRTKDFAETWLDFLVAWDNVKYYEGVNPMSIYEKAIKLEPPEFVVKHYPDNKIIQNLALLCREMQKACGQQPFFLSARTAGGLLKISAMQANRYLRLLQREKVINLVEKGGTLENPRKANRYKYIAN